MCEDSASVDLVEQGDLVVWAAVLNTQNCDPGCCPSGTACRSEPEAAKQQKQRDGSLAALTGEIE